MSFDNYAMTALGVLAFGVLVCVLALFILGFGIMFAEH
jgi:hypothetical protein